MVVRSLISTILLIALSGCATSIESIGLDIAIGQAEITKECSCQPDSGESCSKTVKGGPISSEAAGVLGVWWAKIKGWL